MQSPCIDINGKWLIKIFHSLAERQREMEWSITFFYSAYRKPLVKMKLKTAFNQKHIFFICNIFQSIALLCIVIYCLQNRWENTEGAKKWIHILRDLCICVCIFLAISVYFVNGFSCLCPILKNPAIAAIQWCIFL